MWIGIRTFGDFLSRSFHSVAIELDDGGVVGGLEVAEVVLAGGEGGGVGVAVCAAVGAGIVCADIFRGYAAA